MHFAKREPFQNMGYIKQNDFVTRWKNRRLQFFNFRQGQFLVHSVPIGVLLKLSNSPIWWHPVAERTFLILKFCHSGLTDKSLTFSWTSEACFVRASWVTKKQNDMHLYKVKVSSPWCSEVHVLSWREQSIQIFMQKYEFTNIWKREHVFISKQSKMVSLSWNIYWNTIWWCFRWHRKYNGQEFNDAVYGYMANMY